MLIAIPCYPRPGLEMLVQHHIYPAEGREEKLPQKTFCFNDLEKVVSTLQARENRFARENKRSNKLPGNQVLQAPKSNYKSKKSVKQVAGKSEIHPETPPALLRGEITINPGS